MFNHGGYFGSMILKQNVSSVQECANLAANTVGGVSWTYRIDFRDCVVKNSSEGEFYVEKISGGRECGEMSQEDWDQMISDDCILKHGRGVTGNNIKDKAVENEQECAELAVRTPGGFFWVFNQNQKICRVKTNYNNNDETTDNLYTIMGNVVCGLMNKEQWTLLMNKTTTTTITTTMSITTTTTSTTAEATSTTTQTDPYKLNSVERSRVRKILRRPKECPQSENKEETGFTEQKTTPIIDLFLNPARSEELEDILKRRTASVTRTEVANCDLTTFFFFPG